MMSSSCHCFRLPLLTVTIFLVLLECPFSSSNPEFMYEECQKLFTCGRITAGYPFWGGDRPEGCGHPVLQLQCHEETRNTSMEIEGVAYQVLHINHSTQTMEIARTDYSHGLCPERLPKSSLLDPKLFDYVELGYENLTIYYGCHKDSSSPMVPGMFHCSPMDWFGYVGHGVDVLETCHNNVTVIVPESLSQDVKYADLSAVEKALKKGFEVKWKLDSTACEGRCHASHGTCGFDPNSFPPEGCYCPEPPFFSPSGCRSPQPSGNPSEIPHPPVPPKEPSGNGLKIGLATAGAAIGLILLGGCFFLIYQRRKKIADQSKSRELPIPPASKGPVIATNLSQNMPSYLYSKPDFERSCYFGAQVFSYAELEEATGNFDSSKELGDGGFGTVYFGLLKDGRAVAVKRLYEHNLKRVEQFINEVKILTGLRHQNLVMLYGCTSRHSRELLLVYEYIPNGTVADHLHGNRANSGLLTWPVRLNIAIETASALTYLHGRDVIHRDVKSNNILLDNSFRVKVADFGLSRFFPNNVTHVSTAPQGTPGYVDPEYYQCYQLTNKSDVYSFGVVLIELISSKEAVDINRNRYDINLANMASSRIQNHALNELVDPNLGFEHDISVRRAITSVAELAFQCLQQERDMRPSMDEVLETLQGIQSEELQALKAEVVDIGADDVGLLKNTPPPLSPDSVMTDRWVSSSTLSSSSA